MSILDTLIGNGKKKKRELEVRRQVAQAPLRVATPRSARPLPARPVQQLALRPRVAPVVRNSFQQPADDSELTQSTTSLSRPLEVQRQSRIANRNIQPQKPYDQQQPRQIGVKEYNLQPLVDRGRKSQALAKKPVYQPPQTLEAARKSIGYDKPTKLNDWPQSVKDYYAGKGQTVTRTKGLAILPKDKGFLPPERPKIPVKQVRQPTLSMGTNQVKLSAVTQATPGKLSPTKVAAAQALISGNRTVPPSAQTRTNAQAAVKGPNLAEKTFGVTSGVQRSLIGAGQAGSGLYDLATPGKGTNRFSKAADRSAKYLDAENKRLGTTGQYKGGQFAGEAAQIIGSFGVAGLAKNAIKVPKAVTRVTAPLTNARNSKLLQLEAGGAKQKVQASLLRAATNPTNLGGAAIGVGYDVGQQASKGRDVSPGYFGVSAVANLGLAVGAPALARGVQEGVRNVPGAVRNNADRFSDALNGNSRPFRNINDDQVAAASRVQRQQQGYGESVSGVRDTDAATYRQVQKLLGVNDINDTKPVDDFLGAIQTYQTRKEAGYRNPLFGKPLNQGGYVRIPGKGAKNDPAPDLSIAQKDFINAYANDLENMGSGNGVAITPDGRRVSNNARTTSTAGKNMTKADWFDEARSQIESGKGMYGASDEYRAISNTASDAVTKPTKQLSPAAKPAIVGTQIKAASSKNSTGKVTNPFSSNNRLRYELFEAANKGSSDAELNKLAMNYRSNGTAFMSDRSLDKAIKDAKDALTNPPSQIKIKQPNSGSQVPVNKLTKDGDRITATNVNPNIKRGEQRYALDDEGKMVKDTKGAYRLFTGEDGKVESFRVGNKVYKASELGDLSDVNDYNKVLLSQRRNTERQYGKETAEKVNAFTVDFQQSQATQMINRQIKERDGLQDVADDLGISFGIGRGKAKKVSAAVQDFGEGVKDRAQITQEFGPEMAAKIVKADKYFRARYDGLLDEANAKLKEFGYPPIPKRKNYYTHFDEPGFWEKVGLGMQDIKNLASPTLQDATASAGRSGISNKLAGQSEYMLPNKAFNKFALRREGNKRTADAFGAFERYLSPTLNNIYMTESITRSRVLAKVIGQNADVDGKNISKTIVGLREYANNLAGKSNSIIDRRLADTMYGPTILRASQFAQRRAGGNSIVGNLATAALQPVVLSQTVGKFGVKNFLLGAMQEMSSAHAKTAPIRQSEFMRRRYGNVSAVTRSKVDRAGDVANTPLRVVEQTAARITWNAAYNDALSKGVKGKAAIQQADVQTEKTISGRSIGEKPEAFNSKSLGLVTMYQLEVNNYWQQVSKEMTKSQAAKTLAAAYVFNLGLQAVTGREVGFNPIDAAIDSYQETQKEGKTKTEKTKAIGQRFAGEFVDNTPFIGQAATIGIGDKNLRKYLGPTSNTGRFGVSSPVSALTSNIKVGGIPVPQNLILPFGGGQVKKTTEGAQVLLAGKKTDKDGKTQVDVPRTPVNIARGLAFGSNAIKEVNAYNSNIGLKKVDQKAVPNQIKSTAGTQGLEGLSQDEQEIVNFTAPKDRAAVIADFKGENKRTNLQKIEDKRNGVTTATSSSTTKTGVKSIDDLAAQKKTNKAKLDASLSPTDRKLSTMSKADRNKLIASGAYTQAKFDGLDKYVDRKKQEFGITTASSSVNPKSKAYTRKVLDEYNSIDDTKRTEKAYGENDYDYKVALAKLDNDTQNGTLSKVQQQKRGESLYKLSKTKSVSKEAREVYALSPENIDQYLETNGSDKLIADLLKLEGIEIAEGFRKNPKLAGATGKNGRRSVGKASGGRGGKKRGIKPSDFKTPFDNLVQSSSKGANLARNAKLARRSA